MLLPVGLILVFVLVVLFSNRQTRNCRWRADRGKDAPGHAAFHCVTCGARRFTTDGNPPRQCHVDIPPPSL